MFKLKSIGYPFDLTGAGNGDNIKADGAVCLLRCQVMMRCRYYTRLFAARDTLHGAAVSIGLTKPDLDNHQCLPVGHD